MEDAVMELREDVRALVRERVERHHAVVDEDYGEDLRHEIGLANRKLFKNLLLALDLEELLAIVEDDVEERLL